MGGVSDLEVSFKLSETDMRRLEEFLEKASAVAGERSEQAIVRAAEELVEHIRVAPSPAYILERVKKLDTLVGMLKDVGWSMPDSERPKAIAALAYFVDPQDLIPDQIPVLGFLDDAIMIELAVEKLRHEIAGYERFCRYRHREWERPWYRQSAGTRDRKIAAKQQEIRASIDAKLERDARRRGGARSGA
jgi:uncharacterized membrane protein YkvA (DUF1232 family)